MSNAAFGLFLVTKAIAAEPACAVPRLQSELETALDGAEHSWGVDTASFNMSADASVSVLACLTTTIPPALAARVHRVEGLRAFAVRDAVRARAAFAAARAIDPGYRFPDTMVPADNPLRTAYDEATPDIRTSPVPRARKGTHLHLDGVETNLRPTDRAVVFQIVDDGGAKGGAWLMPEATLPPYARPMDGTRTPLLLAAGGCALAGLGAYAGALAVHDATFTATNLESVQAGQTTANGLVATSAALGVTAVGLGAAAFVVGRW